MSRFGKLLRTAAAAVLTAVGVAPAAAQEHPAPAPANYPTDGGISVAGFGRTGHAGRADCGPACRPADPCAPCAPGAVPGAIPGAMPGTTPGQIPVTPSPITEQPAVADAGLPAFSGLGGGAGSGPTVGLNGYIENAVPVTMFRLRGDFAYRSNRPDRAEFFYTAIPGAPQETIDYQEIIPRLEVALAKRFSAFVDIPTRFLNPDLSPNATGLSDVSFGFKYAFLYNERRVMTLQVLTVTPSGNSLTGLGTGNWWVEPGILWMEQVAPRWQVFGEVRDRIPVAPQTDFTGNVIRYGLGTSYVVATGRRGYVAPVVETVGWTALGGKQVGQNSPVVDPDGTVSQVGTIQGAAGNTVVNLKLGVRIGFGDVTPGSPYPSKSDLYIGYGRALTGAVWYKDLLRVEYRWFF